MTEEQYKRKCDALFNKAKSIGVELSFHPESFDMNRLNCLWYGGGLAVIKVSETLSVTLDVCGGEEIIMNSNEFELMLSQAVNGDNDAIMHIIELYEPLINNTSIIDGKFDDDLKQFILLQIVRKISKFK